MTLIARAARGTRIKNFLIIVMCAVTLGLFVYDGWFGYPARNDYLVGRARDFLAKVENNQGIDPSFLPALNRWTRWSEESSESRKTMDGIINSSKNRIQLDDWKSPLDILIQKIITGVLVLATAGAVWRYVKYQARRVIVEEGTISPALGVVIPWEKISLVDNTRWPKMEIVTLTYTDEGGAAKTVEIDGYYLEREPLLLVLEQLAEKAVKAEFIPKEEEKHEETKG